MLNEADAIVAACEAWPTVHGYVPCHYLQGCACEMVPARVRAAIAAMGQVTDAGQISDGYHTFNELYEHRHALFLALCRSQVDRAWRAQQHHDGSSFEGWFILGIGDQPGHQITYHLPMRLWDDAAFVKTLHRAPEWDGHTSNDVIERIKSSPPEKVTAPKTGNGAA
jgi:hypothetical protein